jgi:hypothetical protein
MIRVFMSLFTFLLTNTLKAAPPRCETVEQDGQKLEICKRQDAMCETLAKEELKNPSKEWNGCNWTAHIANGTFKTSGLLVFSTVVTLASSYMDSERMDVTVTFDKEHCGSRTHVRKDVPIIIRNNLPMASIQIACLDEPYGVPTVESFEKGGKKQAFHSYR